MMFVVTCFLPKFDSLQAAIQSLGQEALNNTMITIYPLYWPSYFTSLRLLASLLASDTSSWHLSFCPFLETRVHDCASLQRDTYRTHIVIKLNELSNMVHLLPQGAIVCRMSASEMNAKEWRRV